MRKAKILREATQVGELNFTTGELTSEDAVLTELWTHWQLEGFNVLGPGFEEPPSGMLADAVHNIKPRPDNMGLVVIELERHGYQLVFEHTPPMGPPPKTTSNPKRFYSRPADTSLEAFKMWITDMTTALGSVEDIGNDEWVQRWREFWGNVDAPGSGGEHD